MHYKKESSQMQEKEILRSKSFIPKAYVRLGEIITGINKNEGIQRIHFPGRPCLSH